jgi:hypothetical protein
MASSIHLFVGGTTGTWRVERISPLRGDSLISVPRLESLDGDPSSLSKKRVWLLRGVTSYERYVTRVERSALVAQQPPLGRPHATHAALLPIKKSAT